MRANLRDVRVQLLIVAGVLLLIDLCSVILLVSPAGRSRAAREHEFQQLRMEKIEKTLAAIPAQGMDQKITTAREQETKFNEERLPHHYSTMSEQISHIAQESGVSVAHVKYDQDKFEKSVPVGYEEVGITVQIRGNYEQDIRFMNAIERQKFLLLIDGVNFGGMQGDNLTVSLHLSTYLRSQS